METSNLKWLDDKIAQAKANKDRATEQGDTKAVSWWEREEENYRTLKRDYENKTKG